MPRDYKARRRPTAGFSGWTGLWCGLAAGLAIAAVVYIKDHRPDAPSARTAKVDKRKMHASESPDPDGADPTPDDSAGHYAFYDQLPKFEVVVPEKDKDVRPDARAVPETRQIGRAHV